jgi:hypothetical protein
MNFDMGPGWLWSLGCLLAVIGALSSVIGIIFGIIWLCRHVTFV